MDIMMAKEIHCAHCGMMGDIDGYDQGMNGPQAKIFKHQGHDPFTGQIHYQCPVCLTTLQVNPMNLLRGEALHGIPVREEQDNYSLQAIHSLFSQKLSGMRKMFQHVRSSSSE